MSGYWSKALELAEDARLLHKNSRYDSACSRAYYAKLNAARALLEGRGLRNETIKTHSTILGLFSREFVQAGIVDISLGSAFRHAEKARYNADYDEDGSSAEEAEVVMAGMEEFMSAARSLLADAQARGHDNG